MRTGPIDRNLTSLKNLAALLSRVVVAPSQFIDDEVLSAALKSQGALAKYASGEHDITPSSLNTHKRLSVDAFTDGYLYLENLRRAAADRIAAAVQVEVKVAKSKRTVSGLSDKVAELTGLLSIAKQDCYHLSGAFVAALREGTNAIADTNDSSLIAKWAKTRSELLKRITLSSRGIYGEGRDGGGDAQTD